MDADEERAYVDRLRQQRAEKSQFFTEHPQSPIPPGEREEFPGLSHFPVDPDYRFVVELDEYDEKESITVETSDGKRREYLRWGSFTVDIGDESVTIQAYKGDADEDRLWVPFRDATSGDATYGAGRYIDLEPDHHTDEGWVLDFNEAYNPTCAYVEGYSCPLPPAENWLAVPVEAGEKSPH
jgi:uncharacterized protein (DUF1684 family)